MPRIRKRILALGSLAGAGLISALRRRAARPTAPAPSAETSPETRPASAPRPRSGGSDDSLVDAETAAAAAAAGAIGGPGVHDAPDGDPAMEPVYEAGGGESEGFEGAEAELIKNASHGDGRGDPSRDAMPPEVESDEATVIAGEADEERHPDGADQPNAPEAR